MSEPSIELIVPNMVLWGELTTTVHNPVDYELAQELTNFYEGMLVPELICAPGGGIDIPHESWMAADGRKAVVTRDNTGTVLGCWIIKEHGIYYPCVNVMKGVAGVVPLLRQMAYTSFLEEGEELYALTTNKLIQMWAQGGAETPDKNRPVGMPVPRWVDDRIEWRS